MLSLPKIYPITDTRLSGLSHVEQVEQLIAGGATIIQLREKIASPKEFYEQAVECVRIAHRGNARIIINDRADIALATKADGVHLGQDDLPPEKARVLLGESAIIGLSTHSFEQATLAANLPIDYIAIGPIFATSTKQDPDPVVGLDGLRSVKAELGNVPVVAIGGISEANLRAVFAAGADSAAMIGAIVSHAQNLSSQMSHLNSLIIEK
ncbi:MAG: thiamine phosphate synthase [Pyrinomonadaceae bacterium]